MLSAPAGAASLDEVEIQSPYPGLLSFTEKDAAFFFGREAEVKTIWTKLRARRLLAVIAPSGAGKTSLVRAGVVASRPEGWGALVSTPARGSSQRRHPPPSPSLQRTSISWSLPRKMWQATWSRPVC